MSHPLRIQRKRTKGWRLPHGATCVTRPGKFGNPVSTAAEFRSLLNAAMNGESLDRIDEDKAEKFRYIAANVHKLRGFKLACFCPLDTECHADELCRQANKWTHCECCASCANVSARQCDAFRRVEQALPRECSPGILTFPRVSPPRISPFRDY